MTKVFHDHHSRKRILNMRNWCEIGTKPDPSNDYEQVKAIQKDLLLACFRGFG